MSDNGKRIARAGGQSVAVWDVKTGKQISALPGNEAPVCALAFSADGKTVVAFNTYDRLFFWDVKEARLLLDSIDVSEKQVSAIEPCSR